MPRQREPVQILPVIEGVCLVESGRETFAVRKADGSVAVRVTSRRGRPGLGRTPVVRGAVRLVRSVFRPLRLLWTAQGMKPQQPPLSSRGRKKGKGRVRLFPAALRVAGGIAAAAAAFCLLPLLLEWGVRGQWGPSLTRAAVCALRCGLLIASVKGIFSAEFFYPMAMYRGAANKVCNSLERSQELDYETLMTESRLGVRSDPAFLLLVALALIVAEALIPLEGTAAPLRALCRAGMAFGLAGLLNELVLPLERVPENPAHRALEWLQMLFTAEPNSDMLEVAGMAVGAARGELGGEPLRDPESGRKNG